MEQAGMEHAAGSLAGIEVCVFDAYGTLLDVRSATARLSRDLDGKAEQLGALWRQRQLEYTWLRSLMHRHRDFWGVTRDALDHAFGAADFDFCTILRSLPLSILHLRGQRRAKR